jgi:hypothetical protein
MARSRFFLVVLPALATLTTSCDEGPTSPSGQRFLAGGGRQAGDDPATGYPGGSGPDWPEFDPPNPNFWPLFYAEGDCQGSPSQLVIANQDGWQAWWTAAIACLIDTGGTPLPPGDCTGDSGVVCPDTLVSPYPPEAPAVDFKMSLVLAISLESDSLMGRSIWIHDVVDDPAGATVHYVVSHLGEDCFGGVPPQPSPWPSSPTIAVLVPRPVTEPVSWQREDVVHNCTWEPDPNEPIAIYYTETPCDLGPPEQVIADAETFDAWLSTALECDQARWYDEGGATGVEDSVVTSPPVPSPDWIGSQVDFSTHAVIVLRSDAQDRWGGGIWLAGIDRTSGGTVIDYTVMIPGENCPSPGGGETVQPTVAIRMPLPLDAPVAWRRSSETISCDWEDVGSGVADSTGVGSGVPYPSSLREP